MLGSVLWPSSRAVPLPPAQLVVRDVPPAVRVESVLQKPGETDEDYLVRLCQRADEGDLEAQVLAAEAYFSGKGTPLDREEACRRYRLAGMADLAFCYLHGWGTVQDREEGFLWTMQAVERGHPPAQTLVGECYLDGRGTETDVVAGEKWLQRAARNGNVRAQILLRER